MNKAREPVPEETLRRFLRCVKKLRECEIVANGEGWRLSMDGETANGQFPTRAQLLEFLTYFRQIMLLHTDKIRIDQVLRVLGAGLKDPELLELVQVLENQFQSLGNSIAIDGSRSLIQDLNDWISAHFHSDRPNELSELDSTAYLYQFRLFPLAFLFRAGLDLAAKVECVIEEAQRRGEFAL
jgi:hypothetical protein